MPDLGCEDFDLDVRLEKPKSRRKTSAIGGGRGPENKNIAPTTLNLPTTINATTNPNSNITSPAVSEAVSTNALIIAPPITDLLSPLDASEITTFNQKHQSSSADTLKTLEDFVAITPLNIKSPANDYRSDDCNELILKELEILESKENERRALVSQSSVEVLPIHGATVGNGVEIEEEIYGEVRFC